MALNREQLDAIGGAIHELHLFAIRNDTSDELQYALAGLQEVIEREISKINISLFMNRHRIIQNRMDMIKFVNENPKTKQAPENDE